MPRISIDPTEIKKHPKFHAFRKKMDWQSHHAFGFLCAFWGEVLNTEANESGDISDWTPEYLADRIGTNNVDPNRLWEALVPGYIEARPIDRFFVRDWIEIAGNVLREKWRSREGGKEHLVEIWRNHGRLYPGQHRTDCGPPEDPQGKHSGSTVGPKTEKNRTIQGWEISVPPSPPSPEDLKAFISPSGSAAPSAGTVPVQNSSSNEERRDAKTRPVVHVLVSQIKQRLNEKIGEEVAFTWEIWAKHVRSLLDSRFAPEEVFRRFENWLASDDPFIQTKLNNGGLFHQTFPFLKDRPIPNRGRSNGRTESFNDGAATVRVDRQPVES